MWKLKRQKFIQIGQNYLTMQNALQNLVSLYQALARFSMFTYYFIIVATLLMDKIIIVKSLANLNNQNHIFKIYLFTIYLFFCLFLQFEKFIVSPSSCPNLP